MSSALDKLVSIGGLELGPKPEFCPKSWEGLQRQLYGLLAKKNGFYAFESALLIRPLGESIAPLSLERWNEPQLWRSSYELELPELHFFAEDVFGGQFALTDKEVVSFDPETGELETISNSVEGWAEVLLGDFEYLTGHSLASSWQRVHGDLPVGSRLVPKQLFVLGGEFEVSNLMCVEDVRGMRSRGFFATELKDVPDGTQVTFELVD